MMRFLFCSKRGIRRAVIFPAAVMLIFTVLNAFVFIIRGSVSPPTDTCYLEAVSLTAFIPAVWFLCDSAFSFGTANGASRRSVIGSLIVVLPLAAVLVTLVSELLCLGLFHGTFFFNDWHLFDATPFSYPKWADTGFDYFLLYAAVFLLLALIIAASVGFVYAAYRKFGVFGALCGVLLILTVYGVLSLMFYADTNIAKTIRPLFLHEYKEYHVFDDGERYCEEFTEARPASFFALVGGYAVLCGTAMALLIRRAGIKAAVLDI